MILKKICLLLLLPTTAFLTACAEQASRVPAAYIPSLVYRGATCGELAQERAVLASHVEQVARAQRSAAGWDTAGVIVGTVIFWPALFALPLTVDQQAQLSSARGHYDALVKAMAEQGCGHGSRMGYAPTPIGPEAVVVRGPAWNRYDAQPQYR